MSVCEYVYSISVSFITAGYENLTSLAKTKHHTQTILTSYQLNGRVLSFARVGLLREEKPLKGL